MGPGSIILGVIAFVCMLGGIFLTLVPVLGSLMSFGAPALALTGLIVGGLGYSQARRAQAPGGAAVAGMVISGTVFVLSLAFALVCGTCNACLTVGATSATPFMQIDTSAFPLPAAPPSGPAMPGAAPVAPAPPPLPPPPGGATSPSAPAVPLPPPPSSP